MKFELTGETRIAGTTTLFRIRALIKFGAVIAGELGGFVEKATNLSQDGDAWVSGNAHVSGDAWVYGDAHVSGDAWVYGDARVSGNAHVSGNARVYGNARVHGNARVYGDAHVSGDARSIKADLWMTLTENRMEAAGVLSALKAGKVNGSTYSGECACLVGTIANVRGCNVGALNADSSRPAEQWFLMIQPGDTPENSSACADAAKWCEEWLSLNGMEVAP